MPTVLPKQMEQPIQSLYQKEHHLIEFFDNIATHYHVAEQPNKYTAILLELEKAENVAKMLRECDNRIESYKNSIARFEAIDSFQNVKFYSNRIELTKAMIKRLTIYFNNILAEIQA